MTTKREDPTRAERQAAALSRIGRTAPKPPDAPPVSAAAYFSTSRGAVTPGKNTHVLPQTRVPEDLACDLAIYGNKKGLSYSETIRVVLRLGLMRVEDYDND